MERRLDCKIKRLNSEKGGEFIGMRRYLASQGIDHTTSPPYYPNQNAIAGRTSCTIIECTRSMLEHASLPRTFWAESVKHADMIRNMFSSTTDRTKTSYELMSGRRPDISFKRVFGCLG